MMTVDEALRHERERLPFELEMVSIDAMETLAAEVRRLREENAALRADADRIDWLADVNNTVGSVVLPREIVEANVSSLRQAIDAARGVK